MFIFMYSSFLPDTLHFAFLLFTFIQRISLPIFVEYVSCWQVLSVLTRNVISPSFLKTQTKTQSKNETLDGFFDLCGLW
jgi:hypothetical protein